MRYLCLSLTKSLAPGFEDLFLRFGSKIQSRSQSSEEYVRSWIFMDVTSYKKSEVILLKDVLELARKHDPQAKAAISDTPAGAQCFAQTYDNYICEPKTELKNIYKLPLMALLAFEGLESWDNQKDIYKFISIFHLLGLKTIGELKPLKRSALRQRWEDLGETLWKRLHGQEKVGIESIDLSAPFQLSTEFRESISLNSLLLYHIEKNLAYLCDRLRGRYALAKNIEIHLSEENGLDHVVNVAVPEGSQELSQIMDLIEFQLVDFNFSAPIEKMELSVQSRPEVLGELKRKLELKKGGKDASRSLNGPHWGHEIEAQNIDLAI